MNTRIFLLLGASLLACSEAGASSDDIDGPEAEGSAESEVNRGTTPVLRAWVPLGLRAALRAAIGDKEISQAPAVVDGALRVSHNYSNEVLEITAPSWMMGKPDGTPLELRFPTLADAGSVQASAPAKKLWNAMKNAKQEGDPNVTLIRTAGSLSCSYSPKRVVNGQTSIEQYACTISNLQLVGQGGGF